MSRKSVQDRSGGFFLWEALLAGLFLLVMAGSAGLYAKAAEFREIADGRCAALLLARAQIAYAQSRLEQDGDLPPHMDYLGDAQDLQQNNILYRVSADSVPEGNVWQLQVNVVWEVHGHEADMEFARVLARHPAEGTAGHNYP